MARRSKAQIRETYNKKMGEDLIAKLSDEQILKEFLKADVDGNGALDAHEFAMMMRRMRSSSKNAKADFLMSRTGVNIDQGNLDVIGNGIYNHFFQT